MNLSTLLLVAVALGTDAFSMAVGIGVGGIGMQHIFQVSSVVTLFHIFMPLIGLSLGTLLGRIMGHVATIIGATVLFFIGMHMLREGLFPENGEEAGSSLARKGLGMGKITGGLSILTGFWGLMLLAASVSLDALSVGFSLGTFQANLPLTVIVMGLVAGLMTASGFIFGKYLGRWLGNKAQVAGGLILIGIGIKLFFG
ncbi:manganese efflux pump MntP family protein [Calderihabitans maritimus]|uniref:Putative manganese efflux pump MntP n=1 Tax=Calderihabitans maritimus TaxID=1246530 RepID=A0A1Z5HWW1_9FIRM|nr:manganese efflux pump [Calderihabitans maritimus]GAW93821.1 hypothetical protein KKC1_29480 [Calderihabitans maritimus]